MSQRRPRLPELPDGEPRQYTVKLVCTNRGRHPRVVLFHLMDTRGDLGAGNVVMWAEGQRNRVPLTSWHPENGAQSFHFHCRRCGRNPPLRQETLFELLDGLAAQPDTGRAHPVVDISDLEYVLSTRSRTRGGGLTAP